MPLFWLSLSFLSGILFSSLLTVPTSPWLWFAGLVFIFHLLFWRGFFPKIKASINAFLSSVFSDSFLEMSLKIPPTLLGVTFFLGAAHFQAVQPQRITDHIIHYNDSGILWRVDGQIITPPEYRDETTHIILEVNNLFPLENGIEAPQTVKGKILLITPSKETWDFGDEISFTSKLVTPNEEEGFSYRMFLSTQGIYTIATSNTVDIIEREKGNILLTTLFRFRTLSRQLIYHIYPDPQASLLAGILLGEDENIPEDVAKAFRDTGTAHIIAISGFNMTIVSGLFAMLFGRLLGAKRGAIAAVFGILLYVLMLGGGASILRAALMSGMSLIARQVGRKQQGLNALFFCAALLCVPNPLLLWDVSFQLSFSATLGLILYAEPLQMGFYRLIAGKIPTTLAQKISQWVGEYFLFTLAAQVTTLPVMLTHFERLSLSSLWVNPLILPAQPLVMILGGVSILGALIYQPLGQLLAWMVLPLLLYTIRVVEWFAENTGSVVSLQPIPIFVVIIYYTLLLGLTYYYQSLKKRMVTMGIVGGISILTAATFIVWQLVFTAPDGYLSLNALDVGEGDALLIQTPGGVRVLINGGQRASLLSDALGRRMPILHRNLDEVIIGSSTEEAIGALGRVLSWYPPKNVLWAARPSENPAARYLFDTINTAQIPLTYIEAGQTIKLDGEVTLHLAAQSKRGTAFILSWRRFNALLLCSTDDDILTELLKEPKLQRTTLIWLGSSAARMKLPLALFTRLRPVSILISAPSTQNLKIMEQWGKTKLLDTQRNGWVKMATDGEQLWVEAQRP